MNAKGMFDDAIRVTARVAALETRLQEAEAERNRLAAELAESQAREVVLGTALEGAREAIESLEPEALGIGSCAVVAADGESGEMTWPLRDELIDRLTKALAHPSPVAEAIGRVLEAVANPAFVAWLEARLDVPTHEVVHALRDLQAIRSGQTSRGEEG